MDAPKEDSETNSLEDPGTSTETQDSAAMGESLDATTTSQGESPDSGDKAQASSSTSTHKQSIGNRVRNILSKVNVYLLLFILIVVIASLIVFVAANRSRKESSKGNAVVQELTPEALKQLSQSESKVGDPKQILNVESNAVFAGKVLIRDSLDVAGGIKLGGSLSVPGITVSGTSIFENIQANTLQLANNATIQGQLSVQKGLTVAGGASFNGPVSAPQLTVTSLQLNGDLQINRHLDAGGNTPGKSDGSAVGIGGTSSVSGSDTAGTVTVNTGGNPPAGCFITVNFSQRFNSTPHVVITPVGSSAAGLNYYITRSTTNFSICTTNPAPASQSFAFDYVAID